MSTTILSPPVESPSVSHPDANPPDSGVTAPPPPPETPSLTAPPGNDTTPPTTPLVPPPAAPVSPPPPSTPPPVSSTPPPPSDPPQSPPPPPPADPPKSSPPPPPPVDPSPPPPGPPPKSSPLPPAADPPSASPPPPVPSPPPPSKLTPPGGSPPPSVTPPAPDPQPAPPPPTPVVKMSPPPPPTPVVKMSPPPPGVPPASSPITPTPSPPLLEQRSNAGLYVGASVGVLGLLAIIILVIWIRRRKRRNAGVGDGFGLPSFGVSSPEAELSFLKVHSNGHGLRNDLASSVSEHEILGRSTILFTFQELVIATKGFSQENLLGEGGFGSVYLGSMADQKLIAVKQLKVGSGQGDREFKAEVEIISRIHHRHLVSLVGYCISDSKRLLVYDYVPNNTLHFHLHGNNRPVMDWEKRLKVVAGAARGIAYLHQDCCPRVIHRDIKSSNIILDNNFEARVSDFGLARIAPDLYTHVTTRVMGTFGYLAPEYASSGKLTEKSDVYSFGVILLEIITGRKPVDSSKPSGEESLVEWAQPLLTQALERDECGSVVDPKLEGNYAENEMLLLIEAATACVRKSAAKRPSMGQVVRAFDSLTVMDLSNGMKVGQSQIIDSAEQAKQIRMWRMAFSQNFNFSQESWNSSNSQYSQRTNIN